jgi:hypothetical protein
MIPVCVFVMTHGLISGSLFGSENKFCIYKVFCPSHLTVKPAISIYGFMISTIVYFNIDLHYLFFFQMTPGNSEVWNKERWLVQ